MTPILPVVGRLAPTPSGELHLGNACAFAAAWLSVRSQGGELLLRFEDVDTTRARQEIEDSQRRDLEWLGLTWDREVTRQSERDYQPAIDQLGDRAYLCGCTRAEIRAAGGVHPSACRTRGATAGALRFMVEPGEVVFEDRKWGERSVDPSQFGDPVLKRKDGIVAYPLAVVADDIADGVTEVVRGADLLDFSALQVVLWRTLGATPPTWMHSPLVLGGDGRKLSKSHGSLHIGAMRDAGWSQADVWRLVLPWLGVDSATGLHDALTAFTSDQGPRGPIRLQHTPGAPCPAPGELAWEG